MNNITSEPTTTSSAPGATTEINLNAPTRPAKQGFSSFATLKAVASILRARGVKNATKLAPIARAAMAKKEAANKKKPVARLAIPIPDDDLCDEARTAARDANRRLQNWESAAPTVKIVSCGAYRTNYLGKYSSKCKYAHYTYTPRYTSSLTLGSNGCAVLHRSGFYEKMKTRAIAAPKGCRFEVDGNGFFVRRWSDKMDYHPTVSDFKAPNFASRVRMGLAENFAKRAQAKKLEIRQRREAKIMARELPSVRVTLLDSRMAGNCVGGALAFAERKLGIPQSEILDGGYLFSVPAKKLLAVANGDLDRVNAAIRVAWNRETTVCI